MISFRSFKGSELLAIKQQLASLKSIIPDKIKLAPSERRSLFKMHAKRDEFVRHAISFMRRNPSTLPSYVDIQSCNNYLQLYDQYAELLLEVDEIKRQLEDAKLLVGHEIMRQTRSYFQHTKNGAESGEKQFESIYQSLKPFYAVGRNSRKLIPEREK